MVSEGGGKFACQMSMYERRGLSTNNAWLNVCHVDYTELMPSIKWDD